MSFRNYLQLQEKHQLTHLDHLEDLLWLQGYKGGLKVIEYLEKIVEDINQHKATNLSIKVDGAPSIIAGWSPEDGRFFVGTKAFFNNTPKVNYTPEDVDKNHGHAKGLADKLKLALEYLPKAINKGNIIQGDFMYSSGDLKFETIDSVEGVSFHPNTIKYHVAKDSGAYGAIVKSKIGIIWHTTYTGNTLDSLNGAFKVSSSSYKLTKDVYSKDVNVSINTIAWSSKEYKDLKNEILQAKKAIHNLNEKGLNDINKITGTQTTKEIMVYINNKVRNGDTSFRKTEIRSLIEYIMNKYEGKKLAVAKKYKTQKTIDKKTSDLDIIKADLIKSIQDSASSIYYLFKWFYNIKEIKLLVVNKLNQLETDEKMYAVKDGKFEVTDPEGWVISDGPDKGVKLINRAVFSNLNFSNPKFK